MRHIAVVFSLASFVVLAGCGTSEAPTTDDATDATPEVDGVSDT